MSYIPNKAMHHAHADPEPGTGGGELGGVPDALPERTKTLGWILGAAGAGVVVAAVAGLLSLRSSSAKPAPKRRAPRKATTPRATAKRTAKAKKAAA